MIIIWTKTLMPGMGLGKSPAGRRFDSESGEEIKKVMNEIRLRVSHLRYIGVSEVVIRSLFRQEIQLSRLAVTEDFQAFRSCERVQRHVLGLERCRRT